MPSASNKAADERASFLRLANLLGEAEQWTSIESRNPPEPDLLCTHSSRGTIAFELVAITDPLIAQVSAGNGTSSDGSYWTSDPTERIIRKKLSRKYTTLHSMELLVYNDLLVITPEESIVETVVAWLNAKDHPFTRAWFCGERSAAQIWTAGEA